MITAANGIKPDFDPIRINPHVLHKVWFGRQEVAFPYRGIFLDPQTGRAGTITRYTVEHDSMKKPPCDQRWTFYGRTLDGKPWTIEVPDYQGFPVHAARNRQHWEMLRQAEEQQARADERTLALIREELALAEVRRENREADATQTGKLTEAERQQREYQDRRLERWCDAIIAGSRRGHFDPSYPPGKQWRDPNDEGW